MQVSCNCHHLYTYTGRVRSVLIMSPVTCGTCDATFTRQSACNRHQLGHKPDSFIPCQKCDFISTRNDSMKRHMTRYHSTNNAIDESQHSETPQQPIGNSIIQPIEVPRADEFDKRLQLPNNFIYSGSSQSVSIFAIDR